MATMKTLFAVLMTVIGLVTAPIESEIYEERAQEFYEETQESMNETFNEEAKEELKKNGVEIQEVTVHYERNENYDNAYTFRADVSFNGHTVSEILVVDMKDNTNLEYYGLVDDKLLTADETEYWRDLLSIEE